MNTCTQQLAELWVLLPCQTVVHLLQTQRKKGVVTASAGNHALALAYHGHLLNIPVTVVTPETAPIMKVRSLLCLSAHLDTLIGKTLINCT